MIKEYPNLKRELSVLEFQLSRCEGIDYDTVISSLTFSKPGSSKTHSSGSWTLTHHVLGGRVLNHGGVGHLKEQPLGYQGVPGLLPEILQLPGQELTAPLPIRWGTPFCLSTGWAWGQV